MPNRTAAVWRRLGRFREPDDGYRSQMDGTLLTFLIVLVVLALIVVVVAVSLRRGRRGRVLIARDATRRETGGDR